MVFSLSTNSHQLLMIFYGSCHAVSAHVHPSTVTTVNTKDSSLGYAGLASTTATAIQWTLVSVPIRLFVSISSAVSGSKVWLYVKLLPILQNFIPARQSRSASRYRASKKSCTPRKGRETCARMLTAAALW